VGGRSLLHKFFDFFVFFEKNWSETTHPFSFTIPAIS
jgi:hypothetical protein